MPAYMVDLDHQPDDQVFSYYHRDGMLHFNVTLLARLHEQMPAEFRRITMDIGQAEYDLCMKHRGIEEQKVEALKPKSLREPGYGVIHPEDNSFTMVDGHHRMVRRYRGGVRVMDFWVTHKTVWQHCLVPYDAEAEAILAKDMPERVENPPHIMTPVTIHNKDK